MGRLPEPYDSNIYYHAFQEMLGTQSKGKNWTWCDVRPDAIVSSNTASIPRSREFYSESDCAIRSALFPMAVRST